MRIGSLFSGYGGLDLGIQLALGEMETAWVSDIEPGPRTILGRRFPTAPNLGDVTQINWGEVEPVDIITGGSPCQDLSLSGRRAGMIPGTRSGLWESMLTAIATIRPRLVVWENVRGSYSAEAFSLMESREGHLGGGADGPVLRALGRVLGDLAGVGYDAQWCGIRASDVGAPHGRYRVFVVAYPTGNQWRIGNRNGDDAGNTHCARWGTERVTAAGETPSGRTPTVVDSGRDGTPPTHADSHLLRKHRGEPLAEEAGESVSHGSADLDRRGGAVKLLSTPRARDGKDSEIGPAKHRPDDVDTLSRALVDFGHYAPAVRRWESALGRSAPSPTRPSKNGKPQLAPPFVEWMMGLPAGWVTDVGLPRTQQLRSLGNGVVPQQAATAIRFMINRAHSLEAA